MAHETSLYTLYSSGPGFAVTPAVLTAQGVALQGAFNEVAMLVMEPSDLIEVGCFITNAAGTGADTFAFQVEKSQVAAVTDLPTILCLVTGPVNTSIPPGRTLRRFKDGTPPNTGAVPATLSLASVPACPVSSPADLWHFERGDVVHFTVTDQSAAGGLGIFYARFQRTGSPRTNRKYVFTGGPPVTTATDTLVDIDSST